MDAEVLLYLWTALIVLLGNSEGLPLNDTASSQSSASLEILLRPRRAVEAWECEFEDDVQAYDEECDNGATNLFPCSPGQLKIAECIGADGDTSQICDPCPQKYFQSKFNRCTVCHECSECGANERIRHDCTDETDTVCESILPLTPTTKSPDVSSTTLTSFQPPSSHPPTSSPSPTATSPVSMTTEKVAIVPSTDGAVVSDKPTENITKVEPKHVKSKGENVPLALAITGWMVALILLIILIFTCLHYRKKEDNGMISADCGQQYSSSRNNPEGSVYVAVPQEPSDINDNGPVVSSPSDEGDKQSFFSSLLDRFVVQDKPKLKKKTNRTPKTALPKEEEAEEEEDKSETVMLQNLTPKSEPIQNGTDGDAARTVHVDVHNVHSESQAADKLAGNAETVNSSIEDHEWIAQKIPGESNNLDGNADTVKHSVEGPDWIAQKVPGESPVVELHRQSGSPPGKVEPGAMEEDDEKWFAEKVRASKHASDADQMEMGKQSELTEVPGEDDLPDNLHEVDQERESRDAGSTSNAPTPASEVPSTVRVTTPTALHKGEGDGMSGDVKRDGPRHPKPAPVGKTKNEKNAGRTGKLFKFSPLKFTKTKMDTTKDPPSPLGEKAGLTD
ncbi:uncharacterized protein [Diadema antillarum]|uniref:uncharacterized protein isoform X2 n=1 Tax=Diadema antillarum TaxID=105358 RepID=UPI003A8998D9